MSASTPRAPRDRLRRAAGAAAPKAHGGAVSAADRSRGLTMIELAIALAVLAVIGALAVPGFGARLERQRLQHAAETLAGDIAEARFQAAQRGHALQVEPRAGAAWCWAVAVPGGCGCGQPPGCALRSVSATDHPGVRLVQAQTVLLLPDGAAGGRPPATAAVFESGRGDRLRVEVSPLGRPRICAAAGPWPQLPPC